MMGDEKDKQVLRDYGMGSGIKIETKRYFVSKKRIDNILPNSSLKEFSDLVMEETKRLTSSENCYVAYVDPSNKDSVGISFLI